MRTARSMSFEPELIEQLVAGRDARAVFERDGMLDKLRLALTERFARAPASTLAEEDADGLDDVAESIARFQVRFPDLGDRIISLHAQGYSLADIQRRASMLIGQTVPPAAISALIEDVRRDALDWRSRALEPSYPIVVFERMRLKWRDATTVQNKVCHFALGFQSHGPKEVLGVWFENGNEKEFWSGVLEDLRQRGVNDVLYFLGSSAHLAAAQAQKFPSALVVAHIGDYVRQSLELATTKDRSALAKALRAIHGACNVNAAEESLTRFIQGPFGQKYAAIGPIWQRHWSEFASYFEVPLQVRCVMASTYAADALRRGYKRSLRGHGHMTSAEDATALMYLAVRDSLRKWKRPQREWHAAKTQLAILFPERFVAG
ncbi:MAG: transposase [Alphaproteobacteria bacterium]|nr:transposase [Alphaproteobacteria bacterium]